MSNEQPESGLESQRRFEELSARVAVTQADIAHLHNRLTEAHDRASATDDRADSDRRRIDDLETRADVDRLMLKELYEDGLLSAEHIAQLQDALTSSRKIGAAIGIVMVSRRVSETDAVDILKRASQAANLKLRVIAEEIVYTGDLSTLPPD
ncbi:ANTAR domain-containing protein [Intrasporangium calvum]|uniref:ANTAR domain-containing protein n=1 Tax=Intrasporangium calvum TaxID=53358 RepID=A0ABT5GHS2_9MICO|nr:ANTAR domain-containing protein [Intrasporangium calvum]MDC5697793.1 ANTAR domain-containing protein [Intrasporangium calvum]